MAIFFGLLVDVAQYLAIDFPCIHAMAYTLWLILRKHRSGNETWQYIFVYWQTWFNIRL